MKSKEMFKQLMENKQNLNEDFIKTYINEYINKFNLHKYLDDVIKTTNGNTNNVIFLKTKFEEHSCHGKKKK